MSVLRHSCGRLRGEGRGTDQKQHCDRWWRLNGTMPGGAPRTGTPCSLRPTSMEKQCLSLMCLMLLTEFFFHDIKVN